MFDLSVIVFGRIGLKAFGNRYRDDTTQQVLKKIGKVRRAQLARCDSI